MEALRTYLKAEHGRSLWLAQELGVAPSAISMWKRIPAERLFAVSRITGIPVEQLRPDLFEGAREAAE